MTRFLKSSLALSLAASALVATPVLAGERAADEAEIATAAVEYRDLDLSTDRGQDRLNARFRRAAQYVCGMDIRDAGSNLPSREARACYVEKLRSFDRQVAMLTEAQARVG
ncbi:UrcA family protein [Erythrobacter alti]|uniref:UrcA family protein n=1 Tax=Erythrobacter alti TaxID=1896145 RepID=UPI0030F44D32